MSASLFLGTDMEEPRVIPVAGGLACVFTERRPGRITVNEDAAAVIPGTNTSGVLAVADGLGGLPAGDMAAAIVVQQLADSVVGCSGELQRAAVLSGLEQANVAILANGQGSGTTIAVAVIDNNTVRACLAGDSMIVVCGQRGKLNYQSVPHSPVGYAEAAGLIGEDEAMLHPDRHLVSNMVGMPDMHVEVGPVLQLALRDTVILGSDGLFDNLYVGEVIELVRSGPLPVAASQLLDACRLRMRSVPAGQPHKPDDLAFILFRRQQALPGQPRFFM
jgi:serine/threonine protein phosphatase PrpC